MEKTSIGTHVLTIMYRVLSKAKSNAHRRLDRIDFEYAIQSMYLGNTPNVDCITKKKSTNIMYSMIKDQGMLTPEQEEKVNESMRESKFVTTCQYPVLTYERLRVMSHEHMNKLKVDGHSMLLKTHLTGCADTGKGDYGVIMQNIHTYSTIIDKMVCREHTMLSEEIPTLVKAQTQYMIQLIKIHPDMMENIQGAWTNYGNCIECIVTTHWIAEMIVCMTQMEPHYHNTNTIRILATSYEKRRVARYETLIPRGNIEMSYLKMYMVSL